MKLPRLEIEYLKPYLSTLNDVKNELIIVISVKDDASLNISPCSDELKDLGLHINLNNKFRNSYIAILNSSKNYLYEKASDKAISYHDDSKNLPFELEVVSCGFTEDDSSYSSIAAYDSEYSANGRGLNFAIFDLSSGEIFDSFNVDSCGDKSLKIMR